MLYQIYYRLTLSFCNSLHLLRFIQFSTAAVRSQCSPTAACLQPLSSSENNNFHLHEHVLFFSVP